MTSLAILGLAACSSSSNRTTAASDTGGNGQIKIMQIGQPKQAYFTNQGIAGDAQTGLEAAIDAVNDAGGIDGHKIQYIWCEDSGGAGGMGSAQNVVQCAQKGLKEGVVAFVGTEDQFAQAVYPVIEKAGIPVLSGSNDTEDETNPLSFYGIANSVVDYAAGGYMLGKLGCAHTAVVSIQPASSYAALTSDPMEAGIKAAGSAPEGPVDVPISQVDFSSTVASIDELKPTPDCLGVALVPTQLPGLLQAIKNSGHPVKVGIADVTHNQLSGSTGALFNGVYSAYTTGRPFATDVSGWTNTPGQNQFIAAVNKYFPGTPSDAYVTDGSYWALGELFIQAAKAAGANGNRITAKSVYNALSRTCNFDPGTTPPVDLCRPGQVKSLPRLFSFSGYIEKIENKQFAVVSKVPFSVANALSSFHS